MADPLELVSGIQQARDAGYTPDEIYGHLATRPEFAEAKKAGYSFDEVYQHLYSGAQKKAQAIQQSAMGEGTPVGGMLGMLSGALKFEPGSKEMQDFFNEVPPEVQKKVVGEMNARTEEEWQKEVGPFMADQLKQHYAQRKQGVGDEDQPLVYLPKPSGDGAVASLTRGAEQSAEGLATLKNIGILGASMVLPKPLQKVVGAGFLAMMAKGVVDEASTAIDPTASKVERLEAAGRGLAGAALVGLGLKGEFGRETEGGATPAERQGGLTQEQADAATTRNQLRALAPETAALVDPKPTGSPDVLDGMTLARRKLTEGFADAPPDQQKVRQFIIDHIDDVLLSHDRTAVNESAVRTAQPEPPTGQQEPPTKTEAPASPPVQGGRSTLFTQAALEAAETPSPPPQVEPAPAPAAEERTVADEKAGTAEVEQPVPILTPHQIELVGKMVNSSGGTSLTDAEEVEVGKLQEQYPGVSLEREAAKQSVRQSPLDQLKALNEDAKTTVAGEPVSAESKALERTVPKDQPADIKIDPEKVSNAVKNLPEGAAKVVRDVLLNGKPIEEAVIDSGMTLTRAKDVVERAKTFIAQAKTIEPPKERTYVDEPSEQSRQDSPEAEALKDWTSATADDLPPAKMKRGNADEAGFISIPKPLEKVARAAGEAVSKPRKMSELDQATAERSAKQQKSFDEAERATKEITKTIPSLRRRNAVSVWLEANGDAATLAGWEAGAKGDLFKQAAKDAQTLTPEEIAIAKKVQGAFDILKQRGQKFEVLKSGRDNYVPHVWDLDKGKIAGFGGGGKLQQNLKFAKARTLENFAEGDVAGMTPKTLDIAKLLPAYLTEMNKVIADRQFVRDIAERNASDGRPLVAARGRVGATVTPEGDYSYLVNPDAGAALKDDKGNPIDTSDYRVMENQPALHDWNFKKSDLQGNPIFMKDDLAVHPEAYKRIQAMLGRSALKDIPLVQVYDKLQSVMKREMFSLLAPFHQVQEGTHGIAHRVSPVSGIEQVDMRKPEMYDAARHGLMLLPDRSTSAGYMEGLGGKGTFLTKTLRWLGEKPDEKGKAELAGKGATALANVVDGYQNYLFHQYIPAMKFKTYQSALERNMSTYAPELKSGKMLEADVKLTTAEQVNAAYGHLNRALLDRNPTAQHLLEMTLLAPDFLEARARFVGQAAKGALGAKVGREQFKALAFMALVQAGTAFAISQLMGVPYDPKKPFSVTNKGREYSLRSVPEDLLRFGTDVHSLATGGDRGIPFVSARINPLLASVGEFVSGKNYRGEKTSAKETAEELIAKYIPITARSIPAIRNLTETSRNNPVSPLEQLAGSLGLKISRASPITETYTKASQWMEKEGIPKDKGSYPVSKYQQLRYALEDGDMDKAANEIARLKKSSTTASIAKGFRESVLRNFTKSGDMDQKFRVSLNGSDKAVFDLAVKNREGILHKLNSIPDSGLPHVAEKKKKRR